MGHSSRRRKLLRFIALPLTVIYLLVTIFGGCADILLLHPTHDPLPLAGATRMEVAVPGSLPVEVFSLAANVPAGAEPAAYLLVFDGNGGRAESAVQWGGSVAGGRAVEVWSMNYPGFGGSPGKASLARIAPAAIATFDILQAKAKGKPIVVWGASIGSTPALHVAAHRQVSAVILTNPPPLRTLIMKHYGWWNLWLAAIPVTLGIPADLDNLANGAISKSPALISSADNDGIVPASYQQLVIDAYAGPKRVVRLHNAGHNTPSAVAAPEEWSQGVEWLWQQLGK